MKILGRKLCCRAVAHDLWDYIGERLPENALERVENHLGTCAVCRIEVEGMRRAQSLLSDCRHEVPSPRSDWRDLQNRMRAEGMISSLTGRVLVQTFGQEQTERPVRRSPLSLDWNRLSLAGSVAATLILSVSIYRLLETPTLNALPNNAANFASIAQATPQEPQPTAKADTHFTIGGDISLPMIPVSSASANTSPSDETPRPTVRETHKETAENAAESPIVWEKKPEQASAFAARKKYLTLAPPSQKMKAGTESNLAVPPLVLPQEGKDAKTRYIMRGLTPASFSEEDGIY